MKKAVNKEAVAKKAAKKEAVVEKAAVDQSHSCSALDSPLVELTESLRTERAPMLASSARLIRSASTSFIASAALS